MDRCPTQVVVGQGSLYCFVDFLRCSRWNQPRYRFCGAVKLFKCEGRWVLQNKRTQTANRTKPDTLACGQSAAGTQGRGQGSACLPTTGWGVPPVCGRKGTHSSWPCVVCVLPVIHEATPLSVSPEITEHWILGGTLTTVGSNPLESITNIPDRPSLSILSSSRAAPLLDALDHFCSWLPGHLLPRLP